MSRFFNCILFIVGLAYAVPADAGPGAAPQPSLQKTTIINSLRNEIYRVKLLYRHSCILVDAGQPVITQWLQPSVVNSVGHLFGGSNSSGEQKTEENLLSFTDPASPTEGTPLLFPPSTTRPEANAEAIKARSCKFFIVAKMVSPTEGTTLEDWIQKVFLDPADGLIAELINLGTDAGSLAESLERNGSDSTLMRKTKRAAMLLTNMVQAIRNMAYDFYQNADPERKDVFYSAVKKGAVMGESLRSFIEKLSDTNITAQKLKFRLDTLKEQANLDENKQEYDADSTSFADFTKAFNVFIYNLVYTANIPYEAKSSESGDPCTQERCVWGERPEFPGALCTKEICPAAFYAFLNSTFPCYRAKFDALWSVVSEAPVEFLSAALATKNDHGQSLWTVICALHPGIARLLEILAAQPATPDTHTRHG